MCSRDHGRTMRSRGGDLATQRGQGLVELALVLPMILLLFFFGAVDFGRAIFTYSTASEAARQAARLGIVDQTVSDVKARAISSAPTLNLTTSNIDVCFETSGTLQRDCSRPTVDAVPPALPAPPPPLQIGCLVVVVGASVLFAADADHLESHHLQDHSLQQPRADRIRLSNGNPAHLPMHSSTFDTRSRPVTGGSQMNNRRRSERQGQRGAGIGPDGPRHGRDAFDDRTRRRRR